LRCSTQHPSKSAWSSTTSTDGANWTLVNGSPGWSARYAHQSLVYDGRMWIMGGIDVGYLGDVWHSTDGITWT